MTRENIYRDVLVFSEDYPEGAIITYEMASDIAGYKTIVELDEEMVVPVFWEIVRQSKASRRKSQQPVG